MIPIIKESDLNTIKWCLSNLAQHHKTREIDQLKFELERAKIVKDDAIDDEIIQLHSEFTVINQKTGDRLSFSLELPSKADLKNKTISILSPLGVALIGFKKGSKVRWTLPGGETELEIISVVQTAIKHKQ